MSVKVEKITEPVTLGEGPHWDHQQQCLYYVDMIDKTVHKYVPATGIETKITLDVAASFVLPVEGTTDQFVMGVGSMLLLLQWDGEDGSNVTIKELAVVDQHVPKTMFNDGKADPRGRLFSGTLVQGESLGKFHPKAGSLYCFDGSKKPEIRKLDSNISIPNGLAWDLKEKAFYYIDSAEKKIRRYDYDVETGDLSNMTYVFEFDIQGGPDGMTIDTDGNLWVAVFGESGVLKINPRTGELLMKQPIPASQVTSVTFGGPDLDILFVTTGRVSVHSEQPPPSGCAFKVTGLGVKGHPNVKVKL